jgi:hypothetical protein
MLEIIHNVTLKIEIDKVRISLTTKESLNAIK